MSLFSNLLGIVGSKFQLGGPTGPQIKNNSGTLQARNSADSAFAVFQVANAVNDNDAVNLITLATYGQKPIPCATQISGASSAPSNSSTVQWILVTTTGGTASIGQIYYDNGTNTGTCDLFSAQTYATIFTPNALTGGTDTFAAGSYYYWTGSAWQIQVVTVAGVDYTTAVTIGTSASYSSTAQILANAIIKDCKVNITTAYSAGGTVSVGISGTTNLFMNTTQNVATTIDLYENVQTTSVGGSAASVLVTIGGSPSVGAGTVYVTWTVPLT